MAKTKFRIALMQTKVTWDKQENLENVLALLSGLNNVDMAILPEMFSCPYVARLFPDYAEEDGDITQQLIACAANQKGIYIVAGSIPERDAQKRVYNTSYVFDRNGKQIAKHRKAHLFDINIENGQSFKESRTLTAGNACTVFNTEFCPMGVCVCYDMRFPEFSRAMALSGAQVIIVPAAFNMTTGPLHWELLFRQRAVDNQVFTIGVAPARDPSAYYVSWAHSIVCSPWGRILLDMGEDAGVTTIEIDLEEVVEVRRQLPLLNHRRPELY